MRTSLTLLLVCAIAQPLSAATAAEHLAAGRAALRLQEHEKARDLFSKAVALQPNDAESHYLLALAFGELARDANILKQASLAMKTRDEFERAVALDPNHVHARLGLMQYSLLAPGFLGGGNDKALAQAAEIKRRNPVEGHRAYALIYAHQKKNDLARKELVEAVRAHPNSARAHFVLGSYLMNEKNWAGSLHELEMALKLDPSYMPTYFRLGQHAVSSRTNYSRGEESLRKYLGHEPDHDSPSLANAWYWLGQLQEKQGKKAEARQSYLNGQKLAPADRHLKEALKNLS